MSPPDAVLVRHAETEWSLSGRHTGRVEVPLTEHGRAAARALVEPLARWSFARVLVSPALRARETCELSGLAGAAELCDDLQEWDYGDYEGLTTADIQERRSGWDLWRDGCPGGESANDVGRRADRVIERLAAGEGLAVVFSHGHTLRVLGARWVGLAPAEGALLGLSTASLSALGREHSRRVLTLWNEARS